MNDAPLPPSPTAVETGEYADKWSSVEHSYLIRSTEHFIVFLDSQGDLDWITTREYDKESPKYDQKYHENINRCAILETFSTQGMPKQEVLRFRRLIGEDLVCNLYFEFDSVKIVLDSIESKLNSRAQEISRCWYLLGSSVPAAIFVIFGAVLWVYRSEYVPLFGGGFPMILAACAGALGALLSVISRTGTLTLNHSAGMWLHYLEGASRIGAGAISGTIAGLAVKSELILAPLSRGEKFMTVVLLAGLTAGVAERMAASIVSTVSSSTPTDLKPTS